MSIARHIRIFGFLALAGISNLHAVRSDLFSKSLHCVVDDMVWGRRALSPQPNEKSINSHKINTDQPGKTVNLSSSRFSVESSAFSATSCGYKQPQVSSRFSVRSIAKIVIVSAMIYGGYKLSQSQRVRAFVGRIKHFIKKK